MSSERPSRPPYGRIGDDGRTGGRAGARSHDSRGDGAPAVPTYYDRPALKPSPYGWLVPAYLFIGGLSGAAQVLAAIADLAGGEEGRRTVRNGRYLAIAGSLASPVLLVADLHTPERWPNMLRIFRRTSAMSIGSWTLTAFGSLSGAAAIAQALHDRTGAPFFRALARGLGLPAAGAGAVMSAYTGVLLASTSTPLWSAAPRALPALFAASSFTTAAAALSLLAGTDVRSGGLDRFALAAGAAESVLGLVLDRTWRRRQVDGPLRTGSVAALYRAGFQVLGLASPVLVHAANLLAPRRSRWLARVADLSALAGGLALRAVAVKGGNESAGRPRDYFRLASREP